jgi:histidinol-phosphate/aromatic aminotransferase/cobyric acid decarboxylase-like protein
MTGPHGDDARQVALARGQDPDCVLDLAASLNPFAPDVVGLAAGRLGVLGRYPDSGDRRSATTALATALAVDPGRVLLTNGGAEAIALVATELGRGWVEEPEFALYRRHLPSVEPEAPRFRSDPHNPTGLLAGPGDSAAVWDEAFYPLATGRWTRGDSAQGEAIVVGSLTKVFACPGLRLGYVLAPPDRADLVDTLSRRQPQWSVNGLALAVLPTLLARADLAGWAASIVAARQALVDVLASHGLVPRRSDANYVLVDGAAGLHHRLADHGVVVRDCTSFGLPASVRMAVPDEYGLARLDAALAAVTTGIGAEEVAGCEVR